VACQDLSVQTATSGEFRSLLELAFHEG
jgi:hypothetical protein